MTDNKISEKEAKSFAKSFPKVHERMYDLIEVLNKIKGGRKRSTIRGFEIEHEVIEVEGELDGCNCCPRDHFYATFPISALWSDDWQEELTKQVKTRKTQEEAEKIRKKLEKEKKKEEVDRKKFLELRDRFDTRLFEEP